MIVNLNTLCKVQLNDFGKQIWLDQIKELPSDFVEQHPEVVDTLKNQIDEHGDVELELWRMMNLFGSYLGQSLEMPFRTTTIEIHKNPDFNIVH